MMYSLALLSFDFHEKDEIIIPPEAMPSAGVAVSWTGKSVTNAPPTNNDARLESLWRIHEAVQRAYLRQAPAQFVRENYDQFAIYFELMRVLHRGQALVARVFGADNAPRPSGPAATVPSKMHAMTVQAMMTVLLQLSPRYACFNEFCGLQGVFPVDAAVYYDEKLVALVEVDGEFHYKLLGQQLRRKDWLKEFLYRCHYPTVPLYRMRLDQLQVIGYPRAGEALANWINRDVQIKIGNIA